MGRRGCTERACDSRPGGYENRGEGGFRGVPLAIVGVVDGDHVFSPLASTERNSRDHTTLR
jgi:hypothetical protein